MKNTIHWIFLILALVGIIVVNVHQVLNRRARNEANALHALKLRELNARLDALDSYLVKLWTIPFADTNMGFLTSAQQSTKTVFRCYETPERMLIVEKSVRGGSFVKIFSTNMSEGLLEP